jgi:hypothetical protein
MKDFKITSYAWRRQIAERLREAGHEAPEDSDIRATLVALAQFLEARSLTRRKLLENGTLIGEQEFALHSSDLTDQGLAVVRAGFGALRGHPLA